MSAIADLPVAFQALMIRTREVAAVEDMTTAKSLDHLDTFRGRALRLVQRDVEFYGTDAAVTIARHAASAAAAREVELIELGIESDFGGAA